MVSADLHVAERADVMRDGSDQQTDAEECDEEADRSQKESSMGSIGNPLVDKQTQFRQVKYQHHQCRNDADKDQEDPGSGNMHTVGVSRLGTVGGHQIRAGRFVRGEQMKVAYRDQAGYSA